MTKFLFDFLKRRDREPVRAEPPKRSLVSYLRPESIQAHLASTSKDDLISELLDILARNGLVKDVAEAKRAVLEREASMSTGMQYGIAVPHARTKAVESLACALGLKKDGMNFGSLDGQPSRIFVLVLFPEQTATTTHLQFMAMISQTLDAPTREKMLSCDTSEKVHALLVDRQKT